HGYGDGDPRHEQRSDEGARRSDRYRSRDEGTVRVVGPVPFPVQQIVQHIAAGCHEGGRRRGQGDDDPESERGGQASSPARESTYDGPREGNSQVTHPHESERRMHGGRWPRHSLNHLVEAARPTPTGTAVYLLANRCQVMVGRPATLVASLVVVIVVLVASVLGGAIASSAGSRPALSHPGSSWGELQ